MERRELYEPEDIEQLLIERSYDELLEMERAFVLRHLSGRAEYEAMRALLLNVHDDAARIEPIDAEPAVRAHVLDVFRAEQQPQWRIWLNSVPAFLMPKEASAMWRPALALGSVALVVWLVVIGTRQMEQASTPQLAELKETKNIEDEKAAKENPQEPEADPQEEVRTEQAQPEVESITFTDVVADDADADQPAFTPDLNGAVADNEEADSPVEMPPPPVAQMDIAVTEELAEGKFEADGQAAAPAATTIRLDTHVLATGAATHIVTANELVHNFSATSATPIHIEQSISTKSLDSFALREKSKKQDTRKRSAAWSSDDKEEEATADAGAYIGLLRAAW